MCNITFDCNSLKLLAFAKRTEQTENNGALPSVKKGEQSEKTDDLPF